MEPGRRGLAVTDGGRARLTVFDRSGRQVAHVNLADAWVGYVAFTSDGDHVVTALEPNRVDEDLSRIEGTSLTWVELVGGRSV